MNPYVGPRTFEEKDKSFFYGREREARDLLAFVISEPLVLFYAQSGAGKSSLINTRLIPGLRAEGFKVLPVGRVGGNLPEGIAEVRNIFTFNLLSNLEHDADPARFTRTLLTDYLSQTEGQGGQPHRVLIIDQFEEIVTHHPGRWQDREDFFWQLQAAVHNDPNLWVMLSMREDHFAAVESYAEILPGGLRARFRMERLRLAAAQMAIERPAADAGRPFENGVAKSLVKNLSLIREADDVNGRQRYGEYIEPVQLQVVCYQLWENLKDRSAKRISNAHVQALGNVDRALGDFYNTAVQEVVAQSNVSELMLRNWFEKKLITEAYTRGTVYQGPEETEGLTNDAVNQLADRYLLRSERRAGAVWYELVHDRFVDPILQANTHWREEQPPIVQAALAWHESGRDEKWLMTAEQAKEELSSLDWQKLDKNVRAYAVACGRSKYQEQRREEILQTKLNQATSRIKRFVWILGILLFFAIVASAIAFASTRDARENLQTAAAAQADAQLEATNAGNAHATSEANAATSDAVAAAAETYSAFVNATATLRTQVINEQETMVASYSQTIVAQNNFATAITEGQNRANAEATIRAQSTEAAAIAVATQNAIQATSTYLSQNAGVILFVRYPPNFDVSKGIIYRVDSNGNNEQALTGSSYSSRDPAWSPDGSEIIFASNIDGDDYEIYVMDANGEDPSQWRQLTNNSWNDRGPAWSPSGEWIAYYSDRTGSDQIYVMRVSDHMIFSVNQNGNFPVWSPDSQRLAFGVFSSGDTRKIATVNIRVVP